ncbi:MAG: NAD(P)-dependent oxidoreductase [Betaproteobacteria bacterium]
MILVTGGAGFVGLNVVEQLLARGDEVFVFDLSPPPGFFQKKISFERGDVSDVRAVADLFSGNAFNSVIHLAAITAGAERDAREPSRIAEVNLIGTINVLEAAHRHGVRRFVHASTGALYGAAGIGVAEPLDEERDRPVPESMYGITKYAAERAVLRLGTLWHMDARIGRLATAFGRWEHATGARDVLSPPTEIAKLAVAGGKAVFPALGPTDYIYAPDLAMALLRLLDESKPAHRLYHLGNGAAWALPRWCSILEKKYPDFRWRESPQLEECNVRPLSPRSRTRFSNRRLVEDLGYAPRYDLAAAADDFITWLGAQHAT